MNEYFRICRWASGVAITVLMVFVILFVNIPLALDAIAERSNIITTLVIAHIPLILLEGIFTVMIVSFLEKVKPELLPGIDSRVRYYNREQGIGNS